MDFDLILSHVYGCHHLYVKITSGNQGACLSPDFSDLKCASHFKPAWLSCRRLNRFCQSGFVSVKSMEVNGNQRYLVTNVLHLYLHLGFKWHEGELKMTGVLFFGWTIPLSLMASVCLLTFSSELYWKCWWFMRNQTSHHSVRPYSQPLLFILLY